MKILLPSLTVCLLLAGNARADLDLNLAFPTGTSSDTAEIRALTGVTGFHEPGDLTAYSLKLANNAITFNYDIKMAPGGRPYHAGAGISVPVPAGKDLRRTASIDFEMKATSKVVIQVIVGSKLYDTISAREGAALTYADLLVDTAWRKISIPAGRFGMSSWYSDCAGECLTTTWASNGNDGATIEIGKAVDDFKFRVQPDAGWNADGSELVSLNSGDFTIRNLIVVSALQAYPSLAIGPRAGNNAFAVSYRNGLVLGGNLQASATVDVLRMDGSLVRSVRASEAASVRLGAGTYLVAVHGTDGFRAVSPLVVVR